MRIKRIFCIVLDSLGVGYQPDAARFGDEGANTLFHISRSGAFSVPNLKRLGLFSTCEAMRETAPEPAAAAFRMREASAGKDTVTGHWEMCGIVSAKEQPTYPNGFPAPLLQKFSQLTQRGILCNRPYSGTQVIADYGEAHRRTGDWIVYTSADSVFQLAAHEDIVPREELYRACEIARGLLQGKDAVGRVIARPFAGQAPFVRTDGRHDFALEPPAETLLDVLKAAGLAVKAVGKIADIFAGRGITERFRTRSNDEGMRVTRELLSADFEGLCFVNLVDFDMLYGHRNDADGYAAALSRFDEWLGESLPELRPGDLLFITGDHGCDPTYPGTDHTREYTPLIAVGSDARAGYFGERASFADLGKTICDCFGVGNALPGESFQTILFGKEQGTC